MLNSVVKKNKGRSQLAEACNHEIAKSVCDAQNFFLLLTVPQIQNMIKEVKKELKFPDLVYQSEFSYAPYEQMFILSNYEKDIDKEQQFWHYAVGMNVERFIQALIKDGKAPSEMLNNQVIHDKWLEETESDEYQRLYDVVLEKLTKVVKEPHYWHAIFYNYLVDGVVYRGGSGSIMIETSKNKFHATYITSYPLTKKDQKSLKYLWKESLPRFYPGHNAQELIYSGKKSTFKRDYTHEIHGFADKYYLYKKYLDDKNFLDPKWNGKEGERAPLDKKIQNLWDEYEEQRKDTDAYFPTYVSGICSDFNKILEDILSIPLTKPLR